MEIDAVTVFADVTDAVMGFVVGTDAVMVK